MLFTNVVLDHARLKNYKSISGLVSNTSRAWRVSAVRHGLCAFVQGHVSSVRAGCVASSYVPDTETWATCKSSWLKSKSISVDPLILRPLDRESLASRTTVPVPRRNSVGGPPVSRLHSRLNQISDDRSTQEPVIRAWTTPRGLPRHDRCHEAACNVKRNVDPTPSSASTTTSPPWASTKVFTMARPSPVDPSFSLSRSPFSKTS